MKATRIIALRHGETAWNVDNRVQGQLDVPLNGVGRAQVLAMAQALAGEPIAAIYASDLWRAYASAEALASVCGCAVTTEDGLRERGLGQFEGKTSSEIEAIWPDASRRWRQREPAFAPAGGGESLLDFRIRVLAAVNRLAELHPGQQIALVAHGGVMDVLYRAATQQEIQAKRTWNLGNAVINRLLWSAGQLCLVGWADARHLEGLNLDNLGVSGQTAAVADDAAAPIALPAQTLQIAESIAA